MPGRIFYPMCFLFLAFIRINKCQSTPYVTPYDCALLNNSIFDSLYIKCTQCLNGGVPDASATQCHCASYQVRVGDSCQTCESGTHPSPDSSACIACEGGDCNCTPSNSVLVYRSPDGIVEQTPRCVTCANGTIPNNALGLCVPCLQPECKCQQDPAYCPNGSTRFISIVNQVPSPLIASQLPWTHVACRNGEMVACQELLNICVLQNYMMTQDNACQLYSDLAMNELRNKLPSISPAMFNTIKTTAAPRQAFRFDESENGRLNIFVAKYHLNGTLLYFGPLNGDSVILCPVPPKSIQAAQTFGVAWKVECEIEMRSLSSYDNVFFELFLRFNEEHTNGTSTRMFLPVYIVSEQLNLGTNMDDLLMDQWRTTRRFFLYDASSSRQENGSTIVRFAKSLELLIYLENSRDGKIGPPLVKIYYDVFATNNYQHPPLATEFTIRYLNDPFRHDKDMEISMAVLCSFSVLWAAVRAYSWGRRAGKQLADATTILQFVLFEAAALGDVFMVVTVVMACWITFAYKTQTYVYYRLLLPAQEHTMIMYLCVATALKFINLLHVNARLMLTETFFIDWERPKMTQAPTKATLRPTSNDVQKDRSADSVVIWRTYLVANEWNELQNYRKTSVGFQVLLMSFLLEFLQWKNLAVVQPGFTTQEPIYGLHSCWVTKFAITIFVYLMLAFLQWALSVLLVERIILDPFHNFIDLCSISNISVISLTHPLHGFYIHGRSVHGRADTDMKDMNEFLQRERDNLCGFRGLETNDELQTYTVNMPTAFRQQYDKLKKGSVLPANIVRMSGTDATTAKISATTKIYTEVNAFLQSVIDHSIPSVDYSIREQSFLEGILDMEFDDNNTMGSFLRDHSEMAFSSCFLYGNEWTCMSFEALLFSVTYLILDSTTFSGLMTYLISHIVRLITSSMFTTNLGKSSFIDHRFLI